MTDDFHDAGLLATASKSLSSKVCECMLRLPWADVGLKGFYNADSIAIPARKSIGRVHVGRGGVLDQDDECAVAGACALTPGLQLVAGGIQEYACAILFPRGFQDGTPDNSAWAQAAMLGWRVGLKCSPRCNH